MEAYKSIYSSEKIEDALKTINEAVVLGGGILTLDNQSSSEDISSALGGTEGFNKIIGNIRSGSIALGIKVDEPETKGAIMASITASGTDDKLVISYVYKGLLYSDEFTLSGTTFSLNQTVSGSEGPGSIF